MKGGVPKNLRVLAMLVLAVAAMGAVAYASVPFYALFCKATGYGGTTQRSEKAPTETLNRTITVTFDSNVDSSLPWDFKPDVRSIEARIGETYTVTYHARNRGDKTAAGMATFNVQPDIAGSYFSKIQCFCFEKQVLKPGQDAALAVQFYLDPALAKDKNMDAVQNITLSYTFFRAKDQNQNVTSKPKSGNPS